MPESSDPVEILARVMQEDDLTQVEVAEMAGTSAQTVNRWLNRRSGFDERKLRKVLPALGRDPQEFGLRPVRGSAGWGPPPGAGRDVLDTLLGNKQPYGDSIAQILDRTADLPQILARLDNMADQLARIEDALKAQQDSPRHA